MKKKYFAFVGILSVFFLLTGCSSSQEPLQKACTQEAKICPDGSAVGRTGPNCEFAACPIVKSEKTLPRENEKVFSDSAQNIQFFYRDPFPTKFISTQTWPPTVSLLNEKFSCQEGGSTIQASGESISKTLDGNTYCITTQSEGAAGSTYTTYTYKTVKKEKLIAFNFVLRFVQCQNYDDPQKTECIQERDAFDPDPLVLRMTESLQFLK